MRDVRSMVVREGGATTVGALVREMAAELARVGIADAKREAGDIVAAVYDAPRFWAMLHENEAVDGALADECRRAAQKRMVGAPFAYAVGRAAFRHLTLHVDERVLIPRQETELLVDEVLARERTGLAIDIGTGSGAIALALASEGAFDRVIGTDVSGGAVSVARGNAERLAAALTAPVEWREGALLAPVAGERARVLASNPPYIAFDEAMALPESVRDWEPPFALYSGLGGMAISASIIRGAPDVLEPGGLLVMELDSRRASLAAELALADGRYRDVAVRLDLAGRERFLIARRKDE
ncbi:MAG: peptide chain release factor N(5)-glutamine methyltransferase [Gemmatimonadaceae bacterium]|nr:peptide chain release factor N(5)-glutamine methyltransferase [Gemmatimonadaceae bacterium]